MLVAGAFVMATSISAPARAAEGQSAAGASRWVPGTVFVSEYNQTHVVAQSPDGQRVTIAEGLRGPEALAVDVVGNAFITDPLAHQVWRVPADGGTPTSVGDDLSYPVGVAVDVTGNVFIADGNLGTVVRVPADGGAQTTVGNGFAYPSGVAVDRAGDVYVADPVNDRVVRVPAGGGPQTTVGEGLNQPYAVAVDPAGNVVIGDTMNDRVVRVWADGGEQTTVSDVLAPSVVAVDGAGNVFFTDYDRVVRVSADGGEQTAIGSYDGPSGLAVFDGQADVGITAVSTPDPFEIGADAKYIFTIGNAGPDSATSTTVRTALPQGLSMVSVGSSVGSCSGTLTVTCSLGSLAVGASATVTVVATPERLGSYDNVATVNAAGLDADPYNNRTTTTTTATWAPGTVFVGDAGSGRVDALTPAGPRITLADGIPVTGVAVDQVGNVFVTVTYGQVVKLPVDGGSPTTVVDGLSYPTGVALDTTGNIFVADSDNNVVLRVPADGSASTTVGYGLSSPYGVAVDPAGDVVIVDGDNHRVVRAAADGSWQTDIVNFGLSLTRGVSVDAAGNVLIADAGNNRVLRVAADGGAKSTRGVGLKDPYGVAVDAAGDLYIADTGNRRVLKVAADGSAQTTIAEGLVAPYGVAVFVAAQDITFTSAPPAAPVPGTAYVVSATGGRSQEPVRFTIDGGSSVVCTVDDHGDGTATVSFTAAGSCVILADQAGDAGHTPAPQASQSVEVAAPNADLGLSMSATPEPVPVGQLLKYTITVANHGPSPATGASLVDVLPAGPSLVFVSPSQGSCAGTNTVTCSLGAIASGSTADVTIFMFVQRTGSYENTAAVSAVEPDPDLANNETGTTTTAIPNADGCTIIGTDSSETIVGTEADDVICGGGGRDTIDGGDGDDVLRGEAGRDTIVSSRGDDVVDGGPGEDSVTYAADPSAVTVSLVDGSAVDGFGFTDSLKSVQVVRGSAFSDSLTGSRTLDRLLGLGADDTIVGLGGDDFLDGGTGRDALDGGKGTDSCVRGETVKRCES